MTPLDGKLGSSHEKAASRERGNSCISGASLIMVIYRKKSTQFLPPEEGHELIRNYSDKVQKSKQKRMKLSGLREKNK